MGTDIVYYKGISKSLESVLDYITSGYNERAGVTLVEAAITQGGTVFAAVKDKERVICVVTATSYGGGITGMAPTSGGNELGYKEMYEFEGPFHYNCPLQVFDRLSPIEVAYADSAHRAHGAADWRKLVGKHLDQNGQPSIGAWWKGGPTYAALQKDKPKYEQDGEDTVVASCKFKHQGSIETARLVQHASGNWQVQVQVENGTTWENYVTYGNANPEGTPHYVMEFAKEFYKHKGFDATPNVQEVWDRRKAHEAELAAKEEKKRKEEEEEASIRKTELDRRAALASKLKFKRGTYKVQVYANDELKEEIEVSAYLLKGFALYQYEGEWCVAHAASNSKIPGKLNSQQEGRRLIAAFMAAGIDFDVPLEELKKHLKKMKAIVETRA